MVTFEYNTGTYDELGKDFEYDVYDSQIENALAKIFYDKYFSKIKLSEENKLNIKSILQDIINEFGIDDNIVTQYYDELRNYFENDAINYYYSAE